MIREIIRAQTLFRESGYFLDKVGADDNLYFSFVVGLLVHLPSHGETRRDRLNRNDGSDDGRFIIIEISICPVNLYFEPGC